MSAPALRNERSFVVSFGLQKSEREPFAQPPLVHHHNLVRKS